MFEPISAGEPILGIHRHELPDQVFCTIGDVIPEGAVKFVVSSHDLGEEVCIVLVEEGRVPTQPDGGGERLG